MGERKVSELEPDGERPWFPNRGACLLGDEVPFKSVRLWTVWSEQLRPLR